jgi:hypothetical protein
VAVAQGEVGVEGVHGAALGTRDVTGLGGLSRHTPKTPCSESDGAGW